MSQVTLPSCQKSRNGHVYKAQMVQLNLNFLSIPCLNIKGTNTYCIYHKCQRPFLFFTTINDKRGIMKSINLSACISREAIC